ncbi:ankyrin repeat-containing domain protein [Leptodontidium sp. 2 PMI_412]|nr:ankyrin repeat-containing domain protein [Leptodontidium sp. 2 PMI_412]
MLRAALVECWPSLEAAKQAIATNPTCISERTDPELYTPLYLAAANGSPEIVELLLQHGANCWDGDDRGHRLLSVVAAGSNRIVHVAASIGHLGMLKSSMERFGMEQLEARNEWGVTPLMAACGGESVDTYSEDQIWNDEPAQIVSFLLQQGGDPLVQDSKGRTLLHTLATFAHGAGSLVEELL